MNNENSGKMKNEGESAAVNGFWVKIEFLSWCVSKKLWQWVKGLVYRGRKKKREGFFVGTKTILPTKTEQKFTGRRQSFFCFLFGYQEVWPLFGVAEKKRSRGLL